MKHPLLIISSVIVVLGALMRIFHIAGGSVIFYVGMSVFFFALFVKKQREKKENAEEN